MPNSMTGFGRAEGEMLGRKLVVEARSVNHRFLDVRLFLPAEMQALESEVQGLIKSRLNRGRVELTVTLGPATAPAELSWNRSLAQGYLSLMRQMQAELGLSGQPDLALLLQQKDVIMNLELESFSAAAWEAARETFSLCLAALSSSRAAEGEALARDLAERLKLLQERVGYVEAHARRGVEAFRERLMRRLKDLAVEADPIRLAQEVVLVAERSDVSEELVRLRTHAAKFGEILADREPVGRRLDFLLQEMNREANTVGAKVQDAELSQVVVEIKAELERMREQVQNLE
jgi:uncharacterized protein (TIGR00255 family)